MLVVMLPHKQLHLDPMVVDECDAVISRSSLGCEIGIAERKHGFCGLSSGIICFLSYRGHFP